MKSFMVSVQLCFVCLVGELIQIDRNVSRRLDRTVAEAAEVMEHIHAGFHSQSVVLGYGQILVGRHGDTVLHVPVLAFQAVPSDAGEFISGNEIEQGDTSLRIFRLRVDNILTLTAVHVAEAILRVAAQAAGRTAEVPEVEDADDDELQTGEVSAREPTNEPEADVPREKVEEPRSKFTEAPDPHATSVTQPKPEPKPMEQSQAQPMTSETETVSCHQSERPPVGRLSEAGRRINEEVGREEHLRALAAAQRLAREGDEAIWEERLRFIKDRLRRTGVWTAAAGVCLLAGILATDLMGLRSRAVESVTSFTVFAPQPAVVDRQAAKKAFLDLAGRAALEDVIVASEAFDELFVLACARVAARENLLLLDSRAVVAMARGGEDATERIKEEIVDLVQKGAVARFNEIRRDKENR